MSASRYQLYACAPTTIRGVPVHLAGDPKGKERIIYTNGKNVIVRNLVNPLIAEEYTEHNCNVTSVRWSQDGNYIASGDVKGCVRVWDANEIFQNTSSNSNDLRKSDDSKTPYLKLHNTYINGRVNDLAWNEKSTHLIIAGEGNMKYVHAVSLNTGSSLGEFIGHHRAVAACDVSPIATPIRVITASEDHTVNVYDGSPFKFRKSIRDHGGWVYDCRFSRNGTHFVTCGADHRIFVYEAKSADKVMELKHREGDSAHTGSVFGIYWNDESSKLVSVSADQTVKLWDVTTGKAINSFEIGLKGDFMEQQLGCLWQADYIVSLSLSGTLHLFDPRQPNRPRTSLYGHSKAITAMSIFNTDKTIFTGSYDGRICSWSLEKGTASLLSKIGHTNQISGLHLHANELISVAMDCSLRRTHIKENSAGEVAVSKLDTIPKQFDCDDNGRISVIFSDSINLIKNGNIELQLPLSFSATSIAMTKTGKLIAIGANDGKLYLFEVVNDVENSRVCMKELDVCQSPNKEALKSLAFNDNGTLLAIGDAKSVVWVYDVESKQFKDNNWNFHSACINSVAWSPSQRYIASGSLDTHIYIWSLDKPGSRICIRRAHRESVIAVGFITEDQLASVGQDAFLKIWSINYK